MMPAYRSMDSYPYQRNQMPFPHCYHPGMEAIPPQMKMDPSKPPFPYDHMCPYAGNCEQSFPMHSCFGHNNFSRYYCYRPAYPHCPAPSPSPIYHSGCYPAYGEPSFVPYSPQPHYTMELPGYEYDKYMPGGGYHCCGCPNHPCHQKEGKSVKIEEQEHDPVQKFNDALVPAQLKNYPYPFVLVPSEYASNKEPTNPVRDEAGEQDKIYHDRKPSGPGYYRVDAQDPRVWNGCVPFDMNGAPKIVIEEDGRRNQNWEIEKNRRESEDGRINPKPQGEHKISEFPFPIIWMPCYTKQEEGGRTDNKDSTSTPKCIEEVPNAFKSVPVNSYSNEGVTKGTGPNQEESTNTTGSDATDKVTKERIIPVQQVELHQGKNGSEGSGKKERNISVNQRREDVAKTTDPHTGVEKQSTSPRKTSKLPPVCLRVDPLPRKKTGNGSSRSPSPPASKEHAQSTANETFKIASGGMNDKAQLNSDCQNASNRSEKVKPKERIIEVSESKTDGSSEPPSPHAPKEHSQATAGETSNISCGSMNDEAPLKIQNATNISDKVEPKQRTIQVTDANENMGAADCRDGCQSRMSLNLPSEVLIWTKGSCTDGDKEVSMTDKGAGNMMEEATERKEVKDSSKPTDGGRKEEKILSDVDAAVLIQAAYRGYQVRKWEPLKKLKQLAEVSEEVTNVRGRIQAFEESSDLQCDNKQRISIGETIMRLLLKLDTIQGLYSSFRETRKSLARELNSLQERLDSIKAKTPQQQMQEFFASKLSEDTPLDVQNGANVQDQQEEVAVPAEESSEGNSHGSHDTSEECQDQSCMKDSIDNHPINNGGSVSQSPMDLTSNEKGTNLTILPNGIVNQDVNKVVTVDSASDLFEGHKMAVEHEAKAAVDGIPVEVDKSDMSTWEELPVGIVEDTVDISSGKDELNENRSVKAMDICLPVMTDDEMIELPVGLLDEGAAIPEFDETKNSIGAEDAECIMELPVGLLDEDTRQPKFEKLDDNTEISEEVLPAECVECNAERSSTDDTAKQTHLEQQLLKEMQSSRGSDGRVKIEFQEEGEHEGDAPSDIEVISQSGGEIENDTRVPSSTTQFKGNELENEDECLEINKDIQPEPVETVITTEEDVPVNDLQKEEKPEEKVTQGEAQVEGAELSAAVSSASKELPVGESDMKLLEENEKLRKMMEKLLEAGNDQLNVISELTGRVKDLEKKLARSKRVRTKRYRPAISKSRSNNPLQHRAIGVAM